MDKICDLILSYTEADYHYNQKLYLRFISEIQRKNMKAYNVEREKAQNI